MLVATHSQQRQTAFKFDFIGFFFERSVPSIVAASANFQRKRVVSRTDGLIALDAHRVEVEGCAHVVGFRVDGIGGVDKNDGQRAGIVHGSRCRNRHAQEQKKPKTSRPDCFHRFFDCHSNNFGAKLGNFSDFRAILFVVFDNQGDGVGRKAFFAACETEFFGGRGFDGNLVGGKILRLY